MSRRPTEADEKAAERERAEIDRRLDAELADTFPASDPPSILRDGLPQRPAPPEARDAAPDEAAPPNARQDRHRHGGRRHT
ncbi:MAG: hypothetical protein ACOY4R_25195 [Pseudomonadota bacterium]